MDFIYSSADGRQRTLLNTRLNYSLLRPLTSSTLGGIVCGVSKYASAAIQCLNKLSSRFLMVPAFLLSLASLY